MEETNKTNPSVALDEFEAPVEHPRPVVPKKGRVSGEEWLKNPRPQSHAEQVTEQVLKELELELEQPKPPSVVVTLPNGYLKKIGSDVIRFNQVKLTDLMLVDFEEMAVESTPWLIRTFEVLQRRVESLSPDGQTSPVISGKEIVDRVIYKLDFMDRLFLLYQLRLHFIAKDYPFVDTCPKCKLPWMYKVALDTMMFAGLKDPMKRRFETTLPSGAKVQWKILDGEVEKLLLDNAHVVSKSPIGVKAMVGRVERITPPTGPTVELLGMSFEERLKYCRYNMSRTDVDKLYTVIGEMEGEADTSFKVTCKNTECKQQFESVAWTQHAGFFYPSQALNVWKQNSSFA